MINNSARSVGCRINLTKPRLMLKKERNNSREIMKSSIEILTITLSSLKLRIECWKTKGSRSKS